MATKNDDYLAGIFSLGDEEPPATMLDHALAEARRGSRVFPLHAGAKVPVHEDFPSVATSDPDQVRRLWIDQTTGWPQPFNIGVLMGDGHVAIDIDVKHNRPGLASLEALNLPAETLIVRTPSGGLHYRYATPRDVRNVVDSEKSPSPLGRGIDVRGHRGYVLGIGSVVDGTPYTVEHDAAPAAVPAHVLDKLEAPRERTATAAVPSTDLDTEFAVARAVRYLREEAPAAVEGAGGDDTTFRVAAIVKDMGLSQPATFEAMAEHWNDRCSPPWDLDELQQKVSNAFDYGLSAPGSQSPAVDFHGVDEIPAPIRVPRITPRLRRLSDGDALVRVRWLLKEWIPAEGVMLLAGQSRIGKTFLAIELAGALATRGSFFGRSVRERVGVLILAAEGSGTIPSRLEGLRLHRLAGMDAAEMAIMFAEIGDPQDIGGLVAEAAQVMPDLFGVRLGVVIVDTLSAAYGFDPQDQQTGTVVLGGLDKLSKDAGILVIGTMHYGKDARAGVLGATSWTGRADVILAATGEISEITGEVKDRKLALTKSRYTETGLISAYDLQSVNIGADDDGDPLNVAIVRSMSISVFDEHTALYMAGLDGLVRAQPEKVMGSERRGVARTLLREHCYLEWKGETPKTKTQWFERAEKKLLKTASIEMGFNEDGKQIVLLAPPVNPASLF